MPQLKLEYLNHASVVLQWGNTRLLTDPWFEGSAISENWGLRYFNPRAFERAATATHLWISHWHSDHYHLPTLKRLASLNPHIKIYANVSATFSMVEPLREMGFRNVESIPECTHRELAPGFDIYTVPAGGIDHMLFVKAGNYSVLNLNDCNVPFRAIRALCRKMAFNGLLLSTFNPSAKILEPENPGQVKSEFLAMLKRKALASEATRYLPFASHHYFRSKHCRTLNECFLDYPDLIAAAKSDPKLVATSIGDTVFFENDWSYRVEKCLPALPQVTLQEKNYRDTVGWDEVLKITDEYAKKLKSEFFSIVGWIPPITIWLEDHHRSVTIHLKRGISSGNDPSEAHISMHSTTLKDWIGRRFGVDNFFAGGDFALLKPDQLPLRKLMLADYLSASVLSFRQLWRLLGTSRGRKFLLNRKEEIMALMLRGRLGAGEWRL